MNFFSDGNNMMLPPNNMGVDNYFSNNNIINKLNELDNRLKRLEQRIMKLEQVNNNVNYSEPNNSLYMI